MATGGLYGQSSAGIVSPQSGSESSGLYGNNTVFGGSYFEWFIFQVADIQPATPTGGSWSFTTNVGTPPSGWLASPPAAPTNTVWVSVGLVNSKSNAAISWSTPGKFSFSSGLPILSGNAAPSPSDGQTDQLYVETGTTPETIWFKQVGTWTRLTGLNLYVDLVSNQTVGGTKTFSSQIQGSVSGNSANVTGVVALANGGTGATNASGARTALELGTIAIQNANLVSISGGAITGITDLAIADGGTGASTAADARTNLGLGSAAVLTAGAALGVATLDAGGTVPLSQIPASIQGGVSYQGTWNATTNSPTLTSSVGSKGYYYVVSTAGSTNLNGITSWNIGDWAIFNGTSWEKIDNTDAVTSVNGYTGTVVLGSMSNQAASNVAITGGAIDGATIGATTASSGKFTTGLVGANANFTDFPNAQLVGSQANTGSGHIYNIGVAGEGVATDIAGGGQWGVGVYGTGATAGATRGIGIVGDGHCGNTADTAAAIGVRGYATQSHSGGQNIGLYAQATGGASNYALFMASGNIYSAVDQTWAVNDNSTSALSFDASGKAGILKLITTDSSESVSMSGALSVTGVATLGAGAILNTPASGNLANCTFPTLNQNTTGNAATATTATNVSGGAASVTTLTTSSTVIHNGGTANGVAYLNGSKVLTTGSALVFDGSNLGIATSSPVSGYNLTAGAGGTTANGTMVLNGGSDSNYGSGIAFRRGGTSKGFIGTQSWVVSGTSDDITLYAGTSGALRFYSNGAQNAILDTSGNLGLGVTPSASSVKMIQGPESLVVSSQGDGLNVAMNAYFNSGWKFASASVAYASNYLQTSGQHRWNISTGTGTAGNAISFTQAMTLDTSGNLLVGTTTALNGSDRISVLGAGANVATFKNSTNSSGYSGINSLLQGSANNTSTYHFWANTAGVGNWYLYGNGTSSFSSDQRLKKNIETTRDGYIEDLCKLRVVKYNWKNDSDGTPKELGLIAQEVEQVFAGLVQDDLNPIEEGGEIYKQVKQSVLPFMLLKAIQEQQAIIEDMKTRLAAAGI